MGSYVISVSVGTGCYRHIQIAKTATLYELHKAIINAFDFEDDHVHAFFMNNRIWTPEEMYYSHRAEGDERLTKDYKLEQFGLSKGDQFKYVFDFGDEWRFQCKILRELDVRIFPALSAVWENRRSSIPNRSGKKWMKRMMTFRKSCRRM